MGIVRCHWRTCRPSRNSWKASGIGATSLRSRRGYGRSLRTGSSAMRQATRPDVPLLSALNIGHDASGLGPNLERVVHLVKAAVRALEDLPDERHEDSAERLTLGEGDSAAVVRLDEELVGAVEDAGKPEAAEPHEAPVRLGGGDPRLEAHRHATRWLDPDREPGAGRRGTGDRPDEWVPFGA